MTREKDGSIYFGSPCCSCSSRHQRREGYAQWKCLECSRLNFYRFTADGYLPFDRETAQGLDEFREDYRP